MDQFGTGMLYQSCTAAVLTYMSTYMQIETGLENNGAYALQKA